ncbi:hypothetical protein EJB05_46182, partial [Eragrostis curvula]
MEGMDSQYGGRWGCRDTVESNSYTISSSSGTFSTAYTSASDSRMSPAEAAATHSDVVWEQVVDKKGRAKCLAQEFFAGNGSIDGAGDMHVMEKWFTQLGVEWVIRPAAGELHHHTLSNAARQWSRVLDEIDSSMTGLFVDSYWEISEIAGMDVVSAWEKELDVTESETQVDSTIVRLQLARFIHEAMLRMCPFVDYIVALNPIHGVPGLYDMLDALLHVHGALSTALRLPSTRSVASSELKRVHGEMVSLLTEKQGKAGEAVWTTMEEIWTRILKSVDTDDSWRDPKGSSGIHKLTIFLTSYIKLLYTHHWSVAPIVSEAVRLGNYVARIDSNRPFRSLIIETNMFLEEKLAQMSLLFPDQSFRFLFLVNNSYFIWEELTELRDFVWESHMEYSVPSKIENYLQSYLHVSWAPVLSCLSCNTTFFLGRSTPLCKFESEFMRTYTTQKLWKVPDPTMRGMLRKAIVERVVPEYRKYMENNNVTTPRITLQELEEMLQELFEG